MARVDKTSTGYDATIKLRATPSTPTLGDVKICLVDVYEPDWGDKLRHRLMCDIDNYASSGRQIVAQLDGVLCYSGRWTSDERGSFGLSWRVQNRPLNDSDGARYYRRLDNINQQVQSIVRQILAHDDMFRGLRIEIELELDRRLTAERNIALLLDQRRERQVHSAFCSYLSIVMLVVLLVSALATLSLFEANVTGVIQLLIALTIVIAVGYACVCQVRLRQYNKKIIEQMNLARQ